ncbi:MAG: hypothetical protein JWR69_3629 [Pedosphaera sp.]|nr:hypothetical protein [Pedosphaera sp.]
MRTRFCLGAFALLFIFAPAHLPAAETRCPFDETKLEFVGSPLEQAKCLLRPVAEFGLLGQPLTTLPGPLESLIGRPVTVNKEKLEHYLEQHAIQETEIGGAITNVLRAKYFVIHDVSAPNYHAQSFPTNINDADWKWNDLNRWRSNQAAHFFVNRLGQSVAPHTLTTPWRATKLESRVLGEKSRGLFVHTELIQPRRADPQGHPGNDGIAPLPGFTEAQLDRLALLYLVASMEHGTWMVPAYHAAIDAGIPDGHDDPQNFDLTLWANRLAALLETVRAEGDPLNQRNTDFNRR